MLPLTPTPDASQWNIGGVGGSGFGHVYFMYISCLFHVVCASFSALATRKLADANPVSSGIWAQGFHYSVDLHLSCIILETANKDISLILISYDFQSSGKIREKGNIL